MGGFPSATGTLAASAQPPVRPSLQEMRDYSTPSQSCLMPSPPSPLSSGEGAAQAGSGLSLLRAAMRRKASNRVALSILWTQPPLPGTPKGNPGLQQKENNQNQTINLVSSLPKATTCTGTACKHCNHKS